MTMAAAGVDAGDNNARALMVKAIADTMTSYGGGCRHFVTIESTDDGSGRKIYSAVVDFAPAGSELGYGIYALRNRREFTIYPPCDSADSTEKQLDKKTRCLLLL